jgi:hypothetical protein
VQDCQPSWGLPKPVPLCGHPWDPTKPTGAGGLDPSPVPPARLLTPLLAARLAPASVPTLAQASHYSGCLLLAWNLISTWATLPGFSPQTGGCKSAALAPAHSALGTKWGGWGGAGESHSAVH